MDDTKLAELAYSGETTQTTTIEMPSAETHPLPLRVESGAEFWDRTQYRPKVDFMGALRTGQLPSGLAEFFQRTKRLWILTAVSLIGLVLALNAAERVAEWARNSRIKRQEAAIGTVTPERLIARCGQPTEDATREVFPIVMRTMTYQHGGEKLALAFSRTDEKEGAWVFLTMQEQSAGKSYETTETKIAALPCLDSTK
jgi:hypothetical protein